MNRAAANMAEQISVEQDVEDFGHLPSSGIAELYSKFVFRFLKSLHTDFQCNCKICSPTNME